MSQRLIPTTIILNRDLKNEIGDIADFIIKIFTFKFNYIDFEFKQYIFTTIYTVLTKFYEIDKSKGKIFKDFVKQFLNECIDQSHNRLQNIYRVYSKDNFYFDMEEASKRIYNELIPNLKKYIQSIRYIKNKNFLYNLATQILNILYEITLKNKRK